ncbi:MAG: glycoside hydrolase family 1 protein [bacterium]|nr:glycoside hydrolase family 1 protein [bacterium]
MPKQKILKFPAGFLWGSSTSAYQIEGGNENDWSQWEKSEDRISQLKNQGKNPGDYICGSACDSYDLYEKDLDLSLELNNNAVKLGLEWSRLEPEAGQWNMEAVEHYRRVLQAAKKRNLKTFVCLWHWTNPLWLTAFGGWTDKKSVDYFQRYAQFVARELGGLVDYWITLNEPMAPIGFGYLRGNFPPARRGDLIGAYLAYRNLTRAHNAGYRAIHKILPRAKVGFISLTDFFEPANVFNPLDWLLIILARYLHHRAFLNRVEKYLDFIGVNYYFHNRLSAWPPFKVNENREINEMGWEIYPAGIYHVVKYMNRLNIPIFITENGIADADDNQRAKFIIEHLRYIHQAISQGAPVKGYFHWSLIDNFEWAHGWTQKFGLYAVDRQTFKRAARPSAKVYAQICKNNQVIVD